VRVVEFAAEDVEDLYACRAFIEGMAARSAAQNVTDEELSDLAELHQQMVRCKTPEDLAQYRELNRRFHALIFSASRRSYIVRTLAQLWSAFPTMLWSNIPRIAVASVPGRDEPDAAEHEEIVAALAARDAERAERAVRRHIESAGEMLVAGMRAQT